MKNLKVSYLLDFYGNLFSEKQREILEMYFQEDMSLSEIASVCDMTRQGVYDNVKRGEKEIISLESRLNLMDKFLAISESIDKAMTEIKSNDKLSEDDYNKIKSSFDKIKSLI